MASDDVTGAYFPPPESAGGWRRAGGAEQARALAGVDLEALAPAQAWNAAFGVPSAVVIIRHGYLVAEWYEQGSDPAMPFNIYSCTKSFTGTAYGMLFDDVQRGLVSSTTSVDLDTPAYSLIPAGCPLTDPRKAHIELRHLLTMTSGIRGENYGIHGLPTAPGVDPLVAAVGRAPFRPRNTSADVWADQLAGEPGDVWDYSDPAFVHLALAFAHITGRQLVDWLQDRVFGPIGIEKLTWDGIGGDEAIGRHTLANGGIHLSARELARFGYLMARGGVWAGQQLVAPWWTALATRTSQRHNPAYGYTWWVNTGGALWSGVPHDAYSALGYNTNVCCIVPSLDLVVVRVGLGPTDSAELITAPFLAAIVAAIVAP
jgi:CubicO group peptidase (beta-lactamase class C family)